MHDRRSIRFCKYQYCTSELPASSKPKSLKRNLPTLFSIIKTCSMSLEEFKLKRRPKPTLRKKRRNKLKSCSNSKKGLRKCRLGNKHHTSHHRATWTNIKIQACSTTNTQNMCSIQRLKLKMIPAHSRQPHSKCRVAQVNLTATMKKTRRARARPRQCLRTIQTMKTHINQESTKMT